MPLRLTRNLAAPDVTAEEWDPASPQPFQALAGPQFIRANDDGTALVRTRGTARADGSRGRPVEMVIEPGWLAVVADGSPRDEVSFAQPEAVGLPSSLWAVAEG